jgi:hypothetical protein
MGTQMSKSESAAVESHGVEHKAAEQKAAEQQAAEQQAVVRPASPIVNPLALPTGINSSSILRDPRGGRSPSLYPIFVTGTVVAPGALTTSQKINLCYVPQNCFLADFYVNTDVTGTLQDNLSTPTAYCTLAGTAPVERGNGTATQGQNYGAIYGSTARTGSTVAGVKVLVWTPGTLLQINVGAGITPAIPLTFSVLWAPAYDGV